MKNIFKVKDKFNIFNLLFFIIITNGIGYLSASFTKGADKMYEVLIKPTFSPPSIVFPIVWIILYIFMGIAIYRIWLIGKNGKNIKKAIVFFFIQLALNFLWPLIFFRFRLRAIAFLELIILIIFILLTTIQFYKKDKIAGDLMMPYILWSIFAAVLNYSIWLLNA